MKPTRTSYSALTTFENCPAEYSFSYLSGERIDNSSPASRRGTRLHLACEDFLNGKLPFAQLPVELYPIRDFLSIYKQLEAKAEEVWLVDRDWNIQYPHEEDENTLIKAVVDIHYVLDGSLYVIDLKSGKEYPEHKDQLQLYAVMGLLKYPDVSQVVTSALYLCGVGEVTTYTRDQLEGLKMFWNARALLQINAKSYPATPSASACRWCAYAKSKSGPCEHG